MKTSKQTIIAQARELFREHGYTGASMGDLAIRVGLRKASLYTHFASKETLVVAVLELTYAELAAHDDPAQAWPARYARVVEAFAATLSERERCVAFHLAYGVSAAEPEAQAAVQRFFAQTRALFREILSLGMNPERADEEAMDAIARLQGATVWLAVEQGPQALARAVEVCLRQAETLSRESAD